MRTRQGWDFKVCYEYLTIIYWTLFFAVLENAPARQYVVLTRT